MDKPTEMRAGAPYAAMAGHPEHQAGGFDLHRSLALLLRHWRTIVVASALGLAAGLGLMVRQTPLYTATATLLIDARQSNLMRPEAQGPEHVLDTSSIATELSLIRSFALARRVVERLKLVDDAAFNSPPREHPYLVRIKKFLGLKRNEQLAENKTSPDIANAVTAPVNADGAQNATELTGSVLGAIAAVQNGTNVVRNGATWFFNISYTHHDPQVAARLANAIADVYLLDKRETRLQSAKQATAWLSARVASLRLQVEASERAVTDQRLKYNLAFRPDGLAEKNSEEGTRKEEAVIRLRDLERQVQADRALYETLLNRLKEAEQQTNLPADQVRIVAPALTPGGPSNINTPLLLAVSVLSGLAAGILLALLLERLESGFTTMEQTETILRLPVLTLIPETTERERLAEGANLSIPDHISQKPLSRFSESMRSIRLGVQMSNTDQPPRIVLVTSAVPSEGKSTISHGIACSAAVAGQKVLLIDCDLRHPALSELYGRPEGPGLTDLLTGGVQRSDAFCKGELANLTFLPAGTLTRHPPDILGSDDLQLLLLELRDEFGLIVLDGPPVTPVIDSVLLGKLADKLIFVVQWRKTPRDVVMRAVSSLGSEQRKMSGIILNKVQPTKGARYSSYNKYYLKHYNKYYIQ